MSQRVIGVVVAFLIVITTATFGSVLWHRLIDDGSGPQSPAPASSDSSVSVASSAFSLAGSDETGLGLTVPSGFRLRIFADNLSGARDIVQDRFGNFWVSRTDEGILSQLDLQSGTGVRVYDILSGLDKPHGLTTNASGADLYIAEQTRIQRARLYSDAPLVTVAELPKGDRHFTRTIRFGPDERIYVSIGSTCDVCFEDDEEYASIISMNPDGSDRKIVATGLRNSVFFDWSYVTGKLFAADMGRDGLGDDLPPEEINIIEEGADYGWPYCYGNQIRDESFRPNDTFDCAETKPAHIEFQAHSAPLGIAFIPEEGWPEEYWYDLLVARHGSLWRDPSVGYDIIRIPLDAEGNPEGEPVPFISGWKAGEDATGRPVGLLIRPGGTLYITDDEKGVVYILSREGE